MWSKGNNENRLSENGSLILTASLPCMFVSAIALWHTELSIYFVFFILIVLTLTIVYCFSLAKENQDFRLRTLTSLLGAMIDGDYTLRGKVHDDPDYRELLSMVNGLADKLLEKKSQVEEQKLLLEKLMEQIDAAVLIVDNEDRFSVVNSAARKLLFDKEIATHKLSLKDIGLEKLKLHQGSGVVELEKLKSEFFVYASGFISRGFKHTIYLITRADRLLLEQERKSWQSVLRVLSHELNNSLAAICTISRCIIRDVDKNEENVLGEKECEGLEIIRDRAESLRDFFASYKRIFSIPLPNKKQAQLRDIFLKVISLYPNLDVKIKNTDDVDINVDTQQFEQVLINVFKNAIEAMENRGTPAIEVSWSRDKKETQIIIKDFGGGVLNTENVFVPLYTTKKDGSGIGLPFCKQVLINHQGNITIKNRTDSVGAEVVISLPV